MSKWSFFRSSLAFFIVKETPDNGILSDSGMILMGELGSDGSPHEAMKSGIRPTRISKIDKEKLRFFIIVNKA